MRKRLFVLMVAGCLGLSSALWAQKLPVEVTQGLVSGSTLSAVQEAALRSAVQAQVERAVISAPMRSALANPTLNFGLTEGATLPTTLLRGQLQDPTSALFLPNLLDLPVATYTPSEQSKIFLNKRERFSGDDLTQKALTRLKKAEGLSQWKEIAKLDSVYGELKKFSVNGLFAKFKYIGPEPTGVPVILAQDFTLMLEGPLQQPLIEQALNWHPKAILEKSSVGNLSAQVLWVSSGKAADLKAALEDIITSMQEQGYSLRLGVHEVTNFSSTGKVHLHFEKFDEQGIFYNYILYVDFANIRLRYNPIIYGDNLTIRKALQEADNLAAYSYEKLSETKALILSTLIDVLPRLEGTEAFERLEQTVMM